VNSGEDLIISPKWMELA